ncbi:MAG: SDR family oxidoreductase [Treponema sp.]|jgi:NAD(P)-dependent dehydrogenase (short-subunit alcohol dehydrogenase family)|nr:SDR family oxidoreductase [Treponema sp.]
MKLKDRVAFITDGASPAGRGIAARLAEEGALVAANVFPAGLAAPSRAGLITRADPLSKAGIDTAVREVLEKYGRIDSLIFNNNEIIPAALEDCDDETYDRIMGVNIKSAYLYAAAAGPPMKERRSGNFVFVSSIHDEKPFGACFAYSMAKGCLKNLAREMVLDMGKFNIRTNVIEMGPMEGGWEDFYSDLSPLYEHARERLNGPRMGNVRDIAEAVLYFAGDDSGFANGSELRLDGGFLLTYMLRRRNLDRATDQEIKQIWQPGAYDGT